MKKVFMFVIFALLALSVSCGDETKKITKNDNDTVDVTDENGNDSGNTGITDTDTSDTGDTADADTSDTGDTTDTGNTTDADASDTGDTADVDTSDTGDTADVDTSDTGDTADIDEVPDVDIAPDPCALCDLSNRKCVQQGENWVCTGCKTKYYENIDDLCVMKGALGADCDAATYSGEDCEGGKCVDGVCCNSDCNGLCESCNVSEFYKGTCTPFLSGTDPENECEAEDASTCGRNGMCDGLGVCQKYDVSIQCQDAFCSTGTESTKAAFCDGAGICVTTGLEKTNCTPYTCNNTTGVCGGGDCSVNPCSAGYYCDSSNVCQQKKPNGTICTDNVQCSSADCTLDDFGTDGIKYCVPNTPAYCAKESSWYAANYTFCTAAGANTYKKCTPNSWGTAINCTNTSLRGCTPSSYVNTAGYLSPDSCEDTGTGAVCNVDSTCATCSVTYRNIDTPAGTTTLTSVYTFGTTSCNRTCLSKLGTPTDSMCGQTSTPNNHFCYATTYLGKNVGVCMMKFISGATCTDSNQCKSGVCSKAGVCL